MGIVDQVKSLKEDANDIFEALDAKYDDLDLDEPFNEGITHDKWEERMYSLEILKDNMEEIVDSINSFATDVDIHQISYGGFKR
ncbi:MAG: hypothetical protein LUD40_16505 [Phocaeicola dorei]|nr:hypothetical protein [Phocaeicola dorei]